MNRGTVFKIFLSLTLLFILDCAKKSRPTGGPKDEDAPIMVSAKPPHYTTNFDQKEIRIYFDEFIKLEKVMEQLVVSPPLKYQPAIKPLGTASKYISIKILDTLKANTTYSLNFGESVVDNNEKNVLRNFKYVFSTGSVIDSLKISGTVKDAFNLESDEYITVMLYEANESFNDSTVYKEKPLYVGSTLDSTVWEITNIKSGNYNLIALKDKSKNYIFNPKSDKIAYQDSQIVIPKDSVFELTLFKEEAPFALKRASEVDRRHLQFGYEGNPTDLKLNPLNAPSSFEIITDFERDKDTLNVWHKGVKDSVVFSVNHPKFNDTVTVRLRSKKMDSLKINSAISQILHPRDTFKIASNIPIVQLDTTLISFLDKDTIAVPYNIVADKRLLKVNFKSEELQEYRFRAEPGAFKDFFGAVNDTLKIKFKTKKLIDYGSLFLNIRGIPTYPVIIHLLDSKGVKVVEFYSKKEQEYVFLYLPPDIYTIRTIFDENRNGHWDSGSYLEKRKPERVIYFKKDIQIKANWDVKEELILVSE